jgi:hypothetical protein
MRANGTSFVTSSSWNCSRFHNSAPVDYCARRYQLCYVATFMLVWRGNTSFSIPLQLVGEIEIPRLENRRKESVALLAQEIDWCCLRHMNRNQ